MIQKGSNAPAEVDEAQKAAKVLGGEIEAYAHRSILPGIAETRYLVTIGKITSNPGRISTPCGSFRPENQSFNVFFTGSDCIWILPADNVPKCRLFDELLWKVREVRGGEDRLIDIL